MIIQEINATVNGNSLSGEVIVPSPVLASTKQTEDGDLTKSPNFKLKLTGATPGMNIIDTVQVKFTNGDFNYTANMNVINKLQNGTVTLQYVDGLTVEEVTHTFVCGATDLQTIYDLISGDDEVGVTHFLYDGTPVPAAEISFGTLNYHNITVGEPTANDITLTPKTSFPEITTGEFVDTLTATYKGMTATVTVMLTITKESLVIPDNTFYGELTADIHNETLDGETFTLDSYVTATNNDNLKLRTKNMTFDGDKYKFEVGNDNIQYYKLDDGKVFESLRFVELTPEYAQAFLQLGRLDHGTFSQDLDDLIFTVDNGFNTEDLYMNFTDVMNQVNVDMTFKMITVTEKEPSN